MYITLNMTPLLLTVYCTFQRLLGNSTVVLTANRTSKLLLSQYNQDHPQTARFLPIFIAYNYSI
ncbi:hypothetical protein EHQ54_08350 [Proteus mirabilis]|nr:hypothetical protein EHQ54_08350 [Proteus mirabilis]